MKNLIFIIYTSIFLLIYSSCGKADYMSTGKIVGIDTEKCDCCGGMLIVIEGFELRFFEMPNESKINLQTATFPLEVNLNWKYSDDDQKCKTKIDIIDIVAK